MVKVFPYCWPGGAHTLGGILNNPDHTGRLGICLLESNVGKGAKLYGGAGFGGLDLDAMGTLEKVYQGRLSIMTSKSQTTRIFLEIHPKV
jgi:hypothetical protein